jgi:hypothetical protein
MCYNAEVSATTFGLVTLASGWLWIRNHGIDRALAGILFFIGVMQGLEWILWTHLKCDWINQLVSRFIPIYLALQPIFINFIVSWFDAGWAPGYTLLGWICLAFLPLVAWRGQSIQGQCTKIGPTGHLQWPGVPDNTPVGRIIRAFYYVALAYPILTLKNTTFSFLYGFFSILSLFVFGQDGKSWPSLWCHFVNLLAVFAVVRPGQ